MMGYTPVFGQQVKFVLLGGVEIGTDTLLRWYVLHVLLFPFVTVIFMAILNVNVKGFLVYADIAKPKSLNVDESATQAGNCGVHPMPVLLSWQVTVAWGARASRFPFS